MLPISQLDGRLAVIVGGGDVALRHAESLLAAGLRLRVIAPQIDTRLRELVERCHGTIAERLFEKNDVTGAAVVVAASDSADVNARAVADAHSQNVPAFDATEDERAAAARTLERMHTYVKAVVPQAERAPVLRALSSLPIERLARMNPVEGEHEVEAIVERLRGNERAHTTSAICASRASALAMTQTRTVAARLARQGIATTILNVTTTGDRVQDRPISAIGSDNVWVKEIELALRDGRAQYAVHSCKDLPGDLAPDMHLVAISQREDPRDAFCSERYASFTDLPPGSVVGTSSLRRRAQLQAWRPDLRFEDIRGNVDTRLRKLREGKYDAIVLAMAGLKRLGVGATHTVPFSEDEIVPAVAQGALAVEMRRDGNADLANALHAAMNDAHAELAVQCERAALRTLRAGCNAPLGIHARFVGDVLVVNGAYAIVERNHVLRERLTARVASTDEAEVLGEALAHALAERLHNKEHLENR
jgi:hydroxymethylbilane synthase